MPPTTTVVVCAYTQRRWQQIVRAVESLRQQTLPPQQIVVVVDHNPELFRDVKRAFPHLTVLENAYAKGLSGARNTGVARASGEVVAFLDDDARAEPDWLETMLEPYADQEVLGVGSLVRAEWPEERPHWFPPEFDWVVGCSYTGLPTQRAPVRNPIGAGMSFRRAVFDAVGGFDASVGRVGTLPVGCEETELAIRVRRRWPSGQILHEPRSAVLHEVSMDRTTARYFTSRCLAEGRSKAAVARIAGASDALSSERSYVTRTLSAALVREARHLVLQRDLHAAQRAATLVLGVGSTGFAYVRTRAALRFHARRTDSGAEPVS